MKFLLICMFFASMTNLFASEELENKAHAYALGLAQQMNEVIDISCISESALGEEESESIPEKRAYFFPFGKYTPANGCPDASRGIEVVVFVKDGQLVRVEVYND